MESSHRFCVSVNQLQQNCVKDSDPSDESEEEMDDQVIDKKEVQNDDNESYKADDEELDEAPLEIDEAANGDDEDSDEEEEENGQGQGNNELDSMVDSGITNNPRLQALIKMNEMYKTTNSLFKPNLPSKLDISIVSPDLRLLSCASCDYTTQDTEELAKHSRLHEIVRPRASAGFQKMAKDLLKCPECEEWFTTERRLADHQSKAHNKVLLKCPLCTFSTKDTKLFARHAEQHSKRQFTCAVPECVAIFDNLELLREHYTDIHRRITCDKCDKSFELVSSLFEHNKRAHTDKEESQPVLQCPICGHKYNCRTRYEKHVKSHDVSNRLKCTDCDLTFEKQVALEVHINRDHRNCRPFHCQVCSQQFYANEKLLNHLSNKHKIAVYDCDKCDYKTNSKYKMERHRVVHNPDRYKCDVKGCYLIFETRYNLTIHKKIKHQIDESDEEVNSNSGRQYSITQSEDSMTTNDNSRHSETTTKSDNDNSREFFPVTDFLEIDLKGDDNEEQDVIEVSDASNDGQNAQNSHILTRLMKNSINGLNITPMMNPKEDNREEEEEEESEEDDDKITGELYCSVNGCSSVLNNGRLLREHMLNEHKLIKCHKCEKCFQSFSGLYKHKRRYHRSQGQILCQYCDKKFFYQTSYEKHIESHQITNDKPKPLTNSKPIIVLGPQSLLKKPVLKTYLCYDCDQEFRERHQYLQHVATVHSATAFNTIQRSKKSKYETSSLTITEIPQTEEKINCLISGCNMKFVSNSQLSEHMRHKHDITLEPIPPSTTSERRRKQRLEERREVTSGDSSQSLLEQIDRQFSNDGTNKTKVKEEPKDVIIEECNPKFTLFTEFLAKNFGLRGQNSRIEESDLVKVIKESGSRREGCGDYFSYNQNLWCFECNQGFDSFDMLYRHNNEFHNKYRPKYK